MCGDEGIKLGAMHKHLRGYTCKRVASSVCCASSALLSVGWKLELQFGFA